VKIEDVGEKGFLAAVLPKLKTQPNFLNGFGHDASIIDVGLGDTAIVMKIDRAGKPIASFNGWTDYGLWGRLAVTANCSDILAVGGIPNGFMLAISVPRTWDVGRVEEIIMGAQQECEENGVTFLGGDTKESDEPQVVGSSIGIINKNYYIGRKNGSDGDYVLLAGELGGFVSAYLQIKDNSIELSKKDPLIKYLAYPKARWSEANLVNSNVLASGGMDLSDGFYDGLQSIIDPNCGALVSLRDIPYHPFALNAAKRYSIPLFNLGFSVGDWSMLFTVKRNRIDEFNRLRREISHKLRIIGRVIDKKGIYGFDKETGEINIVDGIVNENFRSRMEDEGSFFDSIKNNISLRRIDNEILAKHLNKHALNMVRSQ